MTTPEMCPIFHSDFDGTAVETTDKLFRNIRKYPLEPIPGYRDFVEGVVSGGVEVGEVVSRRPDDIFGQRRGVTKKSIEDVGVADIFSPYKVHLAGSIVKFWESEARKASHIASFAVERAVGMIDDKPHKIGIELARVLEGIGEIDVVPELHPVVLGVVSHEKSREYTGRLMEEARKDYQVDVIDDDNFAISGRGFSFDVVALSPYSYEVGQEFAAKLTQ